jgi:hypothetical protein
MNSERNSRKKDNGILKSVTAQSIKGQSFDVSETLSGKARTVSDLTPTRRRLNQKPFRVIDSVPVFHASCNEAEFPVRQFDIRQVRRWGRMYHPRIVLCSYEIGGDIRFYVDTRVAGFYLLWAATRVLGTDEFGTGAAYDLVAWTPRIKGDTVKMAGFRLVHAALLDILYVKVADWQGDPVIVEDFHGTKEVADILGAIGPTVHRSKSDLQMRLASMPTYLRSLYGEGASIGTEPRTYDFGN